MTTLSDLIARLEAAKEGSDDLDFHVAETLDNLHIAYSTTIEGYPPRWTQSLDAALSLFPSDAAISLLRYPNGTWGCAVGDYNRAPLLDDREYPTGALASSCTAMKAREAGR